MNQANIFAAIKIERRRQDDKWGPQQHRLAEWMLILAEEFGEAAKDANEVVFRGAPFSATRKELIQTAAVIFSILEQYDDAYQPVRGSRMEG